MTTMNYRRLGRSGLKVSELSFGSWVTYGNQMGSGEAREKSVADIVVGLRVHGQDQVARFLGWVKLFENAPG